MSKIRAGNTILGSQYAPPFSVSDNVASGWQLRWNDTIKAFEAFDPDALKKTDGGFDSISVHQVVASGTASGFVIPFAVADKPSLIITINGVKQNQDAYDILAVNAGNTVVQLAEAPFNGDVIEFLGLQATDSGNVRLFVTTGDTGPQWTLPWLAPSKESVLVFINGIKQQTTAYNIAYGNDPLLATTTILTFNGALQPTDEIEVVGILDTNEMPSSPIDGLNLGSGAVYGIYDSIDVAGVRQVIRFKSLAAGDNMTITESVGGDFYTLDANFPSFAGTGSGTGIVVNPSADPIVFRALQAGSGVSITVAGDGSIVIATDGSATTLAGAAATEYATTLETVGTATGADLVFKGAATGNSTLQLKGVVGGSGITVTDTGDDIVITSVDDEGYVSTTSNIYNVPIDARIVGVRTTVQTTVNLPDPALIPVGRRITVKDESGAARSVVNNVVVRGPTGVTIDGAVNLTITTSNAFVTVYSNGTNYFIIAEGRERT